ncbi:site-specific DNA recombinase [Aneurinibacillus soli]|uniref:DNA-invertase hin n=1 Tax=Aneurinibacillus soli TaxID=1500254 RepID=A0A0U5AV24_9BACL|nr:recombinase family protein [Aneurinibacillus soli]PYE63482.1 site-specific DNA recombinase [Aneurinibacillus soli]BAU27585.1 DNA-invertase hin [Aneurinibacillus soli]
MRVAVYIRVSTEEQVERGTIENQIEFATKYCDLHKLEITEWYKDDGISGTIPLEQREAGKQLIQDGKDKKFDLLLIYRLDRLGRAARVILNAVHELEGYGIKIKSMTEPFDTSDPSGRFLLTILAGVADLERSTILDRLWQGANRAARDGKWIGGIVPYGYRVNEDGYLEINEDPLPGLDLSEAGVIRLIFDLITNQDYGSIKIGEHLDALGIPTAYTKDKRKVKRGDGKRREKTSGIWQQSRILGILKNEVYKGIHFYGKRASRQRELIERTVPAVISEEQWEEAQRALKRHRIESQVGSLNNILKGLVKCGECGRSYYLHSYGQKGKTLYYYVCLGKTTHHTRNGGRCSSKNVPREWLDSMVWNDILNFAANPGNILEELKPDVEKQQDNRERLQQQRNLLRKALKEKETEKQSILDLFRKKFISSIDVEIQLGKIEKETKQLQQEEKNLSFLIENEQVVETQLQNAESVLNELQTKVSQDIDFEAKFRIVHSLVKEVKVHTIKNPEGRDKAEVAIRYLFMQTPIHMGTD